MGNPEEDEPGTVGDTELGAPGEAEPLPDGDADSDGDGIPDEDEDDASDDEDEAVEEGVADDHGTTSELDEEDQRATDVENAGNADG